MSYYFHFRIVETLVGLLMCSEAGSEPPGLFFLSQLDIRPKAREAAGNLVERTSTHLLVDVPGWFAERKFCAKSFHERSPQ
jgi:hypothetical protein